MPRFLRFAYAATSSAAIILLLTLCTNSLYPWVGLYLYDPESILRLFALFPVVVGLLAQIWPSPVKSPTPFAAGAAGAGIGLVFGYVAPRAALATSIFFPGYRDLWRIPVINWELELVILLFAIVAGTCALLLSITARSRTVIATVAILVITSMLVPVPAFDLTNHNQELTIAAAVLESPDTTYKPDARQDGNSTTVEDRSLTQRVLGRLREEGVTGQYRVCEIDRSGHGKQVLVVIVLNHPVVREVVLQEPNGLDATYLQQPDGWKMIPPHVPTLDRSLTLKPPDFKEGLADLTMEFVGGVCGDSEIWKTPK